ncbi:MAG: hypothetical protein J1F07_05110 [Muribaculaceae bacterium]|nr:hypothetical protein [Muribaculaceae bacterium]
MKKAILGFVALGGMLLATSCANDADLNGDYGKATKVTISVNVDDVVGTRAIGDGTQATKLLYQVYDSDGTTPVGEQGNATVSNYSATVELSLVSGNSYKVAFWAQNPACTAFNTTDLTNVTIDYTGVTNNYEGLDAFFACADLTVTTGMPDQSVTLNRPFAQVNVGVNSDNFAALGIDASSLTVTGYYNSINLVTGEVGALQQGNLVLGSAAVPGETFGVDADNYSYLSTAYLLVPTSKANYNMDFAFTGTKNYTLNYPNVPLQRNYRTNILTDQDMEPVNFTITVDPNFTNPDLLENGELVPGEAAPEEVGVSDVTVNNVDGTMQFSANITGDVTSAAFVCTPATRAEAEVIEVTATIGNGTITASKPASEFAEGVSYAVTVKLNGNVVPATGEPAAPITPNEGNVGGGDDQGETVTYTASWDKYGKNGSNSSYDNSGDMEMDGVTWTLQGNSQINPWRLGGKNLTGVDRSFFNITPILGNIKTIQIQNGTATATVNSIKVVVSSDSEFSSTLFNQTYDYTSDGTITVENTTGQAWNDCYVKITYNVNCGGSNQYVQLKSVVVTAVK